MCSDHGQCAREAEGAGMAREHPQGCGGEERRKRQKRKKAVTEETGLSSLCRGLGLSHKGVSVP